MIGERWIIYWNEYASDTYLYGTDLVFHGREHVEFKNLLMPPGAVVKTWYSKTNFQRQKIEPMLPMIDGEGAYKIILNLNTRENEQCIGKLIFYDRFDKEVGDVFLRDKETVFRCPLSTYSYCLQLINSGFTELDFYNVEIQELIDEPEENFKENRKDIKKNTSSKKRNKFAK